MIPPRASVIAIPLTDERSETGLKPPQLFERAGDVELDEDLPPFVPFQRGLRLAERVERELVVARLELGFPTLEGHTSSLHVLCGRRNVRGEQSCRENECAHFPSLPRDKKGCHRRGIAIERPDG